MKLTIGDWEYVSDNLHEEDKLVYTHEMKHKDGIYMDLGIRKEHVSEEEIRDAFYDFRVGEYGIKSVMIDVEGSLEEGCDIYLKDKYIESRAKIIEELLEELT